MYSVWAVASQAPLGTAFPSGCSLLEEATGCRDNVCEGEKDKNWKEVLTEKSFVIFNYGMH